METRCSIDMVIYMRDDKGQFLKDHEVPDEWKDAYSLANNGKSNPKNKYPRTEKQLENLRTINIGRAPWNKDNGKIKFICKVCKETVFDKPYRRKVFCSNECRDIYSHIMRGDNHWKYKGKNNNLQRNWSEYREWHKAVLKRDDYTCQLCGIIGGKLQVHHIKSFADYPESRFVVSNGLTVCRKCHLEDIHHWNLTK